MRRYFIFILILASFGSCKSVGSLEFEAITEIKIKSLKGNKAIVEISVLVDNPLNYNIYLKKADFEVLRDGYAFGKAKLAEKVMIKKHSNENLSILFHLEISDRMAIVSGRLKAILSGDDRTKLSLSGTVRAGTKVFSKKIKIEKILIN